MRKNRMLLLLMLLSFAAALAGGILFGKTGHWSFAGMAVLFAATFVLLLFFYLKKERARQEYEILQKIAEECRLPLKKEALTVEQLVDGVEEIGRTAQEEAFRGAEQRMRFVLNWAGKCENIAQDLEELSQRVLSGKLTLPQGEPQKEKDRPAFLMLMERERMALEGMLLQLKSYFRSALGEREYDIEQVEISKVVSDTVVRNAPLFNQKSIGFRRTAFKMYARTDPHLLGMALDELIDNAIRHSARNTYIGILCREEEHTVRVVIEDSGDGIPAEDYPHLFEKGFTGHNEPAATTGMGLYLAKSYVEQLGHTLTVESRNGHGTRAIITLNKIE